VDKPCLSYQDTDYYAICSKPCDSSETCGEGEVCAIGVDATVTELIGECATYGALSPGSACNDEDDPAQLSFEERCSGFYCLGGKCSEVCRDDNDCPEGMQCMEFILEDVDDSIDVCQGI